MHENHMMIILMIRTENKGWLCYCHMLLVSKKQKMEHATLKIRVGQKYTGSVYAALYDKIMKNYDKIVKPRGTHTGLKWDMMY